MLFAVFTLLSCALVNALPGEVAPDKWGGPQGKGGGKTGGVTKIYDGGKGGGVGGSVGNIGIGNGNGCDTVTCDTECKNAGFQSGSCEGGSGSGLLDLGILGQNGICVCVSGATTCSTTTTTTATTCSTTSTAIASTTTTVISTSTAFTTVPTTVVTTSTSTDFTTVPTTITATSTTTSTTVTTTRTTTTTTATATVSEYCLCCTRQTPRPGAFGNFISGSCYTNPNNVTCPLPNVNSNGQSHNICCNNQSGVCTQYN